MTSREHKRLALLVMVSAVEVELSALVDGELLLHPETGDVLEVSDVRAVRQIIVHLLTTMQKRAARLRSVGGVGSVR